LTTLLGCNQQKDFTRDYNNWRYDTSIINNLTKYDTVRQLFLSNFDSFKLSNSNFSFTYLYNYDSLSKIEGHSNDSLPKSILPTITRIIKELGKGRIYGFTISKDSTVEIFLKSTHLKEYFLDVRERLYWKTNNHTFDHFPFPYKDTMISKDWQYLIWFDKRSRII
jgi:hypothetical protein